MRLKIIMLFTIFVFLFMAGCTSLYNNTERPTGHIAPLVKKIQPAVVTVVAYDVNREATNLGSGFFIDKKGYLITNYHVLEGSYAADVKTYDGKKYPIELVVAENKSSDLIKVRVKIPESSIHRITVTETEPSIGDRVLVVGSPLGLEQTVSEGIVSAVRELPVVGKVFQLSAPISPGSSGSPVVNMRGKVVGVASFQATRGQNLNFAVSSKGILDLKQSETPKTLSEWTYDIKMRTPKLVEKLCKQGFNFSIRGEFKDALNYFKEATEKSPNDTVAWYGLGSCYDGLDQQEQAIEAFKQVIRIDPDNAASYFNLGRYYRKLGRYEKAIETYYQAIETDPDHAPSYFDLGMVYGRLEEFKNGEKAFKQALRINPEHAPTHFYMGLTYNNMGHYDAAVTSYKKALKIDPDSAPTLYNLGIAYGGLGDGKAEVEAFKQAIRVDPDFAPAHYNIGLIYLNNSGKAAALEEYKILKELHPDMAEMLFKQIY
ncbi:MAG: tetratricopeptide repeat protein [Deltaproteobacteria bacterium]|nr:tetratricopeptide repeat protein [Deltaproteobacteria bacterium]